MIPISKPAIGALEASLVNEAVASGWVSSIGPFIREFEERFAEFCGVKHCVATANGTVALHLALATLGIKEGDEVIVPDLTFVATANAVRYTQAKPVFADADAGTWCIDPADVARKITPRTRAIVAVHLYGHPAAMDALNELARKNALRVIEDAAEAHGAEYHGKRVGSLGDIGVFSFYGNKIITTGEGGALTTQSDELAERARMLRDHAMDAKVRYWHSEIGFNYRMTNLQAALGVAQLRQADRFIAERDEILARYRSLLQRRGLRINPRSEGSRPVNWMTSVRVEALDRGARDALLRDLRADGVDSRPFFYPMTELPMYSDGHNATASAISASGFNLPTYVGLPDADIRRVCDALAKHLDSRGC